MRVEWAVWFLLLISSGVPLAAQQDVLTYHNDLARTGLNSAETTLTLANVNSTSFGKLLVLSVDGKVDAQPLYVSEAAISAQGTHNVLIVATEHDSVYAFDADNGSQLWHVSALGTGETASDDRSCGQVTPEIGITATSVIDRSSGPNGTVYVVAMSKDSSGGYHQRLHALDLSSGQEEFGGPVEIQATYPGRGDNSSGGNVIFDPGQYKERPGLVLLNHIVYTSWSSHCDIGLYTGWVIGYNESTLAQASVLDFTPNGHEGSLWASGAAPAADAASNVYFLAANGTFDTTLNAQGFPSNGDFGNAFLKLATSGGSLAVADYFNMFNTVQESSVDEDLGSGGALVLPDMTDSGGVIRHLAVGAGKDQNIYLIDRDNMGKFNATQNNIYQELSGALAGPEFGMPAYFNGQIYYGAVGDSVKAYQFTNAMLSTSPVSQTSATFAYPGATPSISANGTTNAIVWVAENTDPAVLHAYDASDLSRELYNSNQAGTRDQFGTGNKFIVPTIANGKVYVGTTSGVGVFGLLSASKPDFSMSVSPASASISPGGSASYTVSLTPAGGFSQAVALACTGAPSLATCAVSPASVTFSGSAAVTATITVSTMASSIASRRWPAPPASRSPWKRWTVLAFLLALPAAAGLRSTRRLLRFVCACVVLSVLMYAACGGGSGNGGGHSSGTPPGTYTLTVTGASNSGSSTLSHNVSLTLTVQ